MYKFEVEVYRNEVSWGKYSVYAKDDIEARKKAIEANDSEKQGIWGAGLEINFCTIKLIEKIDIVCKYT